MKYHATIFTNSKTSLCGVSIRPDTFVYPVYAFKNHYAKDYACKKCIKKIERRLTQWTPKLLNPSASPIASRQTLKKSTTWARKSAHHGNKLQSTLSAFALWPGCCGRLRRSCRGSKLLAGFTKTGRFRRLKMLRFLCKLLPSMGVIAKKHRFSWILCPWEPRGALSLARFDLGCHLWADCQKPMVKPGKTHG